MQTGGIGREETWARFMRLTNDARMRNEGLANAQSMRRATVAGRTMAPAAAFQAPKAAPMSVRTQVNGVSYAAAKPAANVRILGGKFDAYA